MADILAMQERQNLLKVAYRSAIQLVSQNELKDMAGSNPELGTAVFSEIQRLLAEEQRAA
jgi:hypothetical protein